MKYSNTEIIFPKYQSETHRGVRLVPERPPFEETHFLLEMAASIEHSLLDQFLFAAYSVRANLPVPKQRAKAIGLSHTLLQIAKEEMGHLMTVQNIRLALGAQPTFSRHSSLYPFRYRLERVTSRTLAKYLVAECSSERMSRDLDEIVRIATEENDDQPVHDIGAIYRRLSALIESLPARYFTATDDRQATWQDWGLDLTKSYRQKTQCVHIDRIDAACPHERKQQILRAIRTIDEQGDGLHGSTDSHFERLLHAYRTARAFEAEGIEFTWPVCENPSFKTITHPQSILWAQLYSLRYRLLLQFMQHFTLLKGPRYIEDGPRQGDRTARGLLLSWSFDEMRRLSKIARKLVALPLSCKGGATRAGPVFSATEDINLSDTPWADHLKLCRAAIAVAKKLPLEPFVSDVVAQDTQRLELIAGVIKEHGKAPTALLPSDFSKVAHILEELARGFAIPTHGNFWANLTRDEFVRLHPFGMSFLGQDPCDPTKFDPGSAGLLAGLSYMPAHRPTVPPSRRAFIEQWIKQGAPDRSGGQIGVIHESDPRLDSTPEGEI